VRNCQQALSFLVTILQPARFQHVDVRGRSDEPIAELALPSRHPRKRSEHDHEANHDAKAEMSDINEMNACFRSVSEVSQRDEEFNDSCKYLDLIDGTRTMGAPLGK
jgi:hypothetical protein